MNKYLLVISTIILIGLTGCDKNSVNPGYQKEVIIFGYLWGNQPLDAEHGIMIAYTQPLSGTYDYEKAAIKNADVSIVETNSGKTYILDDSAKPGYYFNENLIIEPKLTYKLMVNVEGKEITALTTVPPVLELETVLSTDRMDSIFYDNISREKPVFLNCESTDQIIYVDVYCNEEWENAEYISPFWDQEKPASKEEYEDGSNGEPRHIIAAAKLSDLVSANFPGRYVVDWYSSMIQFYGSYTMQIMAIDDNFHNFITNIEFREYNGGIEGGIGVFGSFCGETFRMMILKP